MVIEALVSRGVWWPAQKSCHSEMVSEAPFDMQKYVYL